MRLARISKWYSMLLNVSDGGHEVDFGAAPIAGPMTASGDTATPRRNSIW